VCKITDIEGGKIYFLLCFVFFFVTGEMMCINSFAGAVSAYSLIVQCTYVLIHIQSKYFKTDLPVVILVAVWLSC